jgi:aryl carrier-like protein
MLTSLNIKNIYTLSPMQEGMYFHFLYSPESTAYVEQCTYTIEEDINLDRLKQSFQLLVNRYEVLRTVFNHNKADKPLQIVLQDVSVDVEYADWTSGASDENIVAAFQRNQRERRFNLNTEISLRLALIKVSSQHFKLIWTHHHILMDGWCVHLLIKDFNYIYHSLSKGIQPSLPEPEPYSKYIAWLQDQDHSRSFSFWKDVLKEHAVYTGLPILDGTRLSTEGYKHKSAHYTVDQSLSGRLKSLAEDFECSPSNFIHGLWGILLMKWLGHSSAVFGSVVSGRPSHVDFLDGMVGLFINTVPYKVYGTPEESVRVILKRSQQFAADANDFQYSRLAEIMSLSPMGNELISHIVVFNNIQPQYDAENGGRPRTYLAVKGVEVVEETNYDFALVVDWSTQLSFTVNFNESVFEDRLVDVAFEYFTHLMQQVVDNPDNLLKELKFPANESPDKKHDTDYLSWKHMLSEKNNCLLNKDINMLPEGVSLILCSEELTTLPVGVPGRGYWHTDLAEPTDKPGHGLFLKAPAPFQGYWMASPWSFIKHADQTISIRGLWNEEIIHSKWNVNLNFFYKTVDVLTDLRHVHIINIACPTHQDLVLCYNSDNDPSFDEIPNELKRLMPSSYMPVSAVAVSPWPLDKNGETNVEQLYQIATSHISSQKKFQEPSTPTEIVMARIWMEILGVNKISVHDNFFRVAGDSIRATRIVSKMKKAGYEVTIRIFFNHPTIHQLALFFKGKE